MTATMHEEPANLPPDVTEALARHGITETDEVPLRRALEARVPGYSLYRLTPAARKRWKCQYRIMLDPATTTAPPRRRFTPAPCSRRYDVG